ncbi:MAG: 16S rRNA (cytidine(1402)-2'-O)-methyltransferase [Leptospiraceae bacterium]|nr:16S rRNA (cytidine(1402)-2'-O)-methyltransferase [Leptospiraceae bacterium]
MSSKERPVGEFYSVATPIGNREDITLRAIHILKNSDLILCEDSRVTIPLLRHLQIETPAKTLHKPNTDDYFDWIWEGLHSGKNYSLVSDAGTPGLSDPGSHVIRYLRSKGFEPKAIPGPSALASLISISGFQANPTLFLGFISEKKGKKRSQLEKARETDGLIVFYESVHKLPVLMEMLVDIFPDKELIVGRELTKIHEESIYYKSPKECFEKPPLAKGEFTFLINNHSKFSLKASRD